MRAARVALAVLSAAALTAPLGAAPPKLPTLDEALLKEAPALLKYAKEKKYKSIGVLKFQVVRGRGAATDHAGPLNLTLARRLELALLLAGNPEDPSLVILRDASEKAATIRGANHMTAAGREKLFEATYQPAWGKEAVKPSAFFTGEACIDADLRRMTVKIKCVDRDTDWANAREVSFEAQTGSNDVIETGYSFRRRGGDARGGDLPAAAEAAAINDAAEVTRNHEFHPLDPRAKPRLKLEIRYDGKPVEPEFRDGRARVRDSRDSEKKMTLVVRRADPANDHERLAFVLKVNGENSLYRQRAEDLACTKWILEPDDKEVIIDGYQFDDKKADEFKLLTRAASKEKELDYGSDLGLISLVVFRERKDDKRVPPKIEDKPDDGGPPRKEKEVATLSVLSRRAYPEEVPDTYDSLQYKLRRGLVRGLTVPDNRRGLAVPGERIRSEVVKVPFEADPTPIMAATVIYYQP